MSIKSALKAPPSPPPRSLPPKQKTLKFASQKLDGSENIYNVPISTATTNIGDNQKSLEKSKEIRNAQSYLTTEKDKPGIKCSR